MSTDTEQTSWNRPPPPTHPPPCIDPPVSDDIVMGHWPVTLQGPTVKRGSRTQLKYYATQRRRSETTGRAATPITPANCWDNIITAIKVSELLERKSKKWCARFLEVKPHRWTAVLKVLVQIKFWFKQFACQTKGKNIRLSKCECPKKFWDDFVC